MQLKTLQCALYVPLGQVALKVHGHPTLAQLVLMLNKQAHHIVHPVQMVTTALQVHRTPTVVILASFHPQVHQPV